MTTPAAVLLVEDETLLRPVATDAPDVAEFLFKPFTIA